MKSLKIICPNGHLGFAPLRRDSFRLGVAERPDYIAADSGSDDIGPVPLGTDTMREPRRLAASRSGGDAACRAARLDRTDARPI